ncbi:helix-turn-helix domain-containing protein, partial [Leptospira interrogans]
ERGDSRPSADKLKALAEALGVTTDYLLDGNSDNAARVNLEDQELLEMFKRVQQLPQEKKESIKDLIEAYLFREKIRKDIHIITK